jgi:hypothetical protein
MAEHESELVHRLLDHAKYHRWHECSAMLRAQRSLVNASLCGRWPVLCQAAECGDESVVRELLRHRADPRQRNRDGMFPWQLAAEGSNVRALLQGLADQEASVEDDDASKDFVPKTFNQDLMGATTASPLIGDRRERPTLSPDFGKRMLKGLKEERAKLLQEIEQLGQAERVKKFNGLRDLGADLQDQLQSDDEQKLRNATVTAYTAESWVYPVLNSCMRENDESKTGLADFAHLLNDTIATCPAPLARWQGKSWRWVNMNMKCLKQYKHHMTHRRQNLVSFAGFTSACKDPAQTIKNMHTFKPKGSANEDSEDEDSRRRTRFCWSSKPGAAALPISVNCLVFLKRVRCSSRWGRSSSCKNRGGAGTSARLRPSSIQRTPRSLVRRGSLWYA